MILVLIFLAIIIVLTLLILAIFSLTIQINIKDLEVGNINKRAKWKIILQIKLLDKFVIYKVPINKIKSVTNSKIFRKLNIKKDIENKIKFRKKDLLDLIRGLKLEVVMLNLKIWLGVEDAILTSFIVTGIASAIGIILPFLIEQKNMKSCKYFVNPIYMQKDLYNIKLESIIKVKMVHIINIIYILTMKGRDKNERTSDRRSYDYSNGFN